MIAINDQEHCCLLCSLRHRRGVRKEVAGINRFDDSGDLMAIRVCQHRFEFEVPSWMVDL